MLLRGSPFFFFFISVLQSYYSLFVPRSQFAKLSFILINTVANDEDIEYG
ncbi:hypothetical protein JHK86_040952 [Glycine max]|nr:hypothetical protein JHK86_040952 [Glycine max]